MFSSAFLEYGPRCCFSLEKSIGDQLGLWRLPRLLENPSSCWSFAITNPRSHSSQSPALSPQCPGLRSPKKQTCLLSWHWLSQQHIQAVYLGAHESKPPFPLCDPVFFLCCMFGAVFLTWARCLGIHASMHPSIHPSFMYSSIPAAPAAVHATGLALLEQQFLLGSNMSTVCARWIFSITFSLLLSSFPLNLSAGFFASGIPHSIWLPPPPSFSLPPFLSFIFLVSCILPSLIFLSIIFPVLLCILSIPAGLPHTNWPPPSQ